jgi:zinc and cadmium transporter
VGLVTWAAAAAHETPQELGDFGILIHAGWSKGRALAFNLASALTFLVGGLVAYTLADTFEVTWLLLFAAGNFVYIAAADLIPELTGYPDAARKALLTARLRPRPVPRHRVRRLTGTRLVGRLRPRGRAGWRAHRRW